MTKSKIMRSPKTARTFNQICELRTDNVNFKWGWALIGEGEITITVQKSGEKPSAKITIPKRDFNRLIRWYEQPTAAKDSRDGV